MKRPGLEKARGRLKEAFAAFEHLKVAATWEDFESAWTRLLTALNSTYAILGQSAKGNAKSEGWFARVLGQRRADELLSYMMHARNANDHGIADVIKLEPPGISVSGDSRGKGIYIKKAVFGPDGISELEGWQEDGRALTVKHHPARTRLVPVIDRGQTYHPPKTFLGKNLKDTSPIGVAYEVLEFMVMLFTEAETLVAAKTA